MNDLEIVRETIELFLVHYFDSIEMAGSVKKEQRNHINYICIDLKNNQLDEGLEDLHLALSKYLKDWANKNISNFEDYINISRLTIDYIIEDKSGNIKNKSKQILLFNLPSYFFKSNNKSKVSTYPRYILYILQIWYNSILRNTILVSIGTVILLVTAIFKLHNEKYFICQLSKVYDNLNIASSIMASLALGFIISKIISIRQDKLKYTEEITNLSNQLTYFRNICFNLNRDHSFWSKYNPYIESYKYANNIKDHISFEEYYYPNFDDNVLYAKYKSYYNDNYSHNVVLLILQLNMMADESFLDSGLTFTKFPPNHIYTEIEMEKFLIFSDSNQIWYCCSEMDVFPDIIPTSYYQKMIVNEINRIYPNKNFDRLTKDSLEEISTDFQYRIIPRLFNLIKKVNSGFPISIMYFGINLIILLVFALIVPTLNSIFFANDIISIVCISIVVGTIFHILLSLREILNRENTLDLNQDYL